MQCRSRRPCASYLNGGGQLNSGALRASRSLDDRFISRHRRIGLVDAESYPQRLLAMARSGHHLARDPCLDGMMLPLAAVSLGCPTTPAWGSGRDGGGRHRGGSQCRGSLPPRAGPAQLPVVLGARRDGAGIREASSIRRPQLAPSIPPGDHCRRQQNTRQRWSVAGYDLAPRSSFSPRIGR